MNHPVAPPALTADQMRLLEMSSYDAMDSIMAALAYGQLVAFGIQPINGVPTISLVFPADEEGGTPRALRMSVPQDAPNASLLLFAAGDLVHKVLQEYHGATEGADAYVQGRARTTKLREGSKRRIIMPSKS